MGQQYHSDTGFHLPGVKVSAIGSESVDQNLAYVGVLVKDEVVLLNKTQTRSNSSFPLGIPFCQRDYNRRRARKSRRNRGRLTRERNEVFNEVAMNDPQTKHVPHPPGIPRGQKTPAVAPTGDRRLPPVSRGGRLPPLSQPDSEGLLRKNDFIIRGNDSEYTGNRKGSVDGLSSGNGDTSSSEYVSIDSTSSDEPCNNTYVGGSRSVDDGETADIDYSKGADDCDKSNKFSNVDSKHRTHAKKSEFDGDIVDSYEEYMREITRKEETGSLSSDEYSVSSLSDDGDDDDHSRDDIKLTSNLETTNPYALYSLPIKKTINQGSRSTAGDSMNNLLGQSTRLKTLILPDGNTYISMDNHELLRSQSDPNLRRDSMGNIRGLRTNTYLLPVDKDYIAKLTQSQSSPGTEAISSSDMNQLKFRPLPPIPASKSINNTEHDSLYETIQTCQSCQLKTDKQVSPVKQESSESSVRQGRLTFKAVANTIISVMPRVTTQEARNRKMDKTLADLKQYLPDQKLRILLGTWNMKGTKVLPHVLDDFILPPESVYIQDIYAIGTQEGTPFRREWELRLQETLGPSHVLIHSCNFGVLQLSIFVRREIVWYCTGLEQDSIATRMGHKIKTKGALAVSFSVFGTSLLFINSHFTSDEGKLKDRLNDYRSICKSLSMPFGIQRGEQDDDVTQRFDKVFWFGDFNFRVQKSRSDVDKILSESATKKEKTIKELLRHDQLTDAAKKGKIFCGFNEPPITFLPTYKLDVNTDSYDTSAKRRVPSWTDRIMWKSRRPDHVDVISYNSCESIKNSDHRPVYCVVEVAIEPIKNKYTVPGGRFDRDIYVEANLRRHAPTGSQSSSNVCVIL